MPAKKQPEPRKTAGKARAKQFKARELDKATKKTGQRGNLEQNAHKGTRTPQPG
ncbi:MAG: hypothetical protein JO348_10615 [Alphaproteobacteria bacterium]|nr:hypothetical protein [Alphaproteobacteria bacterium]MBV9420214.1 hypothetical protein [Alphaproteobacteria bacterium]